MNEGNKYYPWRSARDGPDTRAAVPDQMVVDYWQAVADGGHILYVKGRGYYKCEKESGDGVNHATLNKPLFVYLSKHIEAFVREQDLDYNLCMGDAGPGKTGGELMKQIRGALGFFDKHPHGRVVVTPVRKFTTQEHLAATLHHGSSSKEGKTSTRTRLLNTLKGRAEIEGDEDDDADAPLNPTDLNGQKLGKLSTKQKSGVVLDIWFYRTRDPQQ